MQIEQAKPLYLMQAELVDAKVELSVNKVISQVVDQIIHLRQEIQRDFHGLRHELHQEIHSLRNEMNERFSKVESRLSSVETALGKREKVRGEIRTHFVDYAFKAAWLLGCSMLSATVASLIVLAHS